MGIYRGLAPLKAYKGDMQPVNVYKGSTKVAGWHSASYSGTSPLTVDCDYNVPPDALVIDGKCVQTGTPSPDSPAPISTITGNVTITGADGAESDTATVAFGSDVCASLPDGTHDTYDAVTGVLTKKVGKVVLDGSEGWWYESNLSGTSTSMFICFISGAYVYSFTTNCLSSHFPAYASAMRDTLKANNTEGVITGDGGSSIVQVLISTARLTANKVADFKSWLAANPVTVYYKLATPTTVQLVPNLPVVRTGIKTLSVGADVVPTLSATVKSMD